MRKLENSTVSDEAWKKFNELADNEGIGNHIDDWWLFFLFFEKGYLARMTKGNREILKIGNNIKVYEEPPQLNNIFDKYTIIIGEEVFTMSENPNSPQGFNQYWGNIKEFSKEHFKNKKELSKIPIEIVKAIINRII